MKKWPLTAVAVAVALSAGTLVVAQTADDRKVLSLSVNTAKMKQLTDAFQAQFDRDETAVDAFLQSNPGLKRSSNVNGASRYLTRIDADGQPVYIETKDSAVSANPLQHLKNRASGQLIKADSLYPGGSLGVSITGTGMIAGIWDSGLVRATHELLSGKVANQAGQSNTATEATGFSNHMTHVTGTVVGKDMSAVAGASTDAIAARGIAYGASAKNYDWTADKTEMTAFAAGGGLVSNHSYGYANDNTTPLWKFGAYDSEALDWDVITKNAPYYLPFVAAGNEQTANGNTGKTGALQGFDVITGSSAAKNVMTVGAVLDTKAIAPYTNFGPTDDGRLKPDIVAKGTGITSSYTATDSTYNTGNGTSYATPAASAAALLLQQYFYSLNNQYMLASTLKALMINTAEDLGNPGPDVKFGWGLLNVEAAATAIKQRSGTGGPAVVAYTYPTTSSKGAIIEEITYNPIVTGEMSRLFYAKGDAPIKATMCWLDDEGTEQLSTDGTDPTTNRNMYAFGALVRVYTDAAQTALSSQTFHWLTPTMAAPNANATRATGTGTAHPNTCAQVVSTTTPNPGAAVRIFMRKQTGSPAAARTVSLVVTGVYVNPTFDVTASAAANGSLTCGTPGAAVTAVSSGTTTTCTAVPNANFATASISGCGGTATTSGVNAYTTGAISANCTVTATFAAAAVNGVCGTANTVASIAAPSANLCASGTAGAVTPVASSFGWSCVGGNGGGTASCAAPRLYAITTASIPSTAGSINCGTSPYVAGTAVSCTATPNAGFTFTGFSGDCSGATCTLAAATGDKSITANFAPVRTASGQTVPSNALVTATFTTANGGATCRFDAANTGPVASPAAYPTAGSSQPHGMFKVKLIGCTPGFTARLSVTWPSLGAVYTKYGRTPASAVNSFYAPSNLTISGNTASFDVTDGGLGDDDQTVNSEIIDPSGPVVLAAVQAQVVPVPTLDGRALLALIFLMLGAGLVIRKRTQR